MPLECTAALALTAGLQVGCGALLHRAAAAPPGPARAPAVLVAVTASVLIPLLFDRSTAYTSIGMISFLTAWLASFKALAFGANRGPLAAQTWSLPQFVMLYALPIVPTDPHREQLLRSRNSSGIFSGSSSSSSISLSGKMSSSTNGGAGRSSSSSGMVTSSLVGRWVVKFVLLAAVVFGLLAEPPQVLKDILYVLGMYALLGVVMDGPASLGLSLLGLTLEPHFRPPWESKSISQFWGYQWNQAASNSLRTTIYEPLMEGRWVRKPKIESNGSTVVGPAAAGGPAAAPGKQQLNGNAVPQAAATAHPAPVAAASSAGKERRQHGQQLQLRMAAALCASCLASAVIHEVIIIYTTGRTTRGYWFVFFVIQGPLILAERWALRFLRSNFGIQLPTLVRIAYTLTILLFLGHHLFFVPAERMGLCQNFAAAMRHFFVALAGLEAQPLPPVRWG